MGQITPQLLDTMQIPWAWFPEKQEDVENTLQAAISHMGSTGRPYALIMKKGMVAPYPTLTEISKRAAGQYYTPRLFQNPTVKRVVRFIQKYA